MATISHSFPLFRENICMHSGNTKAQMETARRCVEQNIQAIARHVRKGVPQAISEAKRRLEVANQAYIEVRTVLNEQEKRTRDAMRSHTRAYVSKSLPKGPQYAEALKEARNAYAKAEKVFGDNVRALDKAREKVNYYEIARRRYKAKAVLDSEKARLLFLRYPEMKRSASRRI